MFSAYRQAQYAYKFGAHRCFQYARTKVDVPNQLAALRAITP